MPDHRQVSVKACRKVIRCDAGVAPLVEWMNRLPGIRTKFSCQGKGRCLAYVWFKHDNPKSRVAIRGLVQAVSKEVEGRRRAALERSRKRPRLSIQWLRPFWWTDSGHLVAHDRHAMRSLVAAAKRRLKEIADA